MPGEPGRRPSRDPISPRDPLRPQDPARPRDPNEDVGRRGRFGLPAPEDPDHRGLFRPNRKVLYGLLVVIVVLTVVRIEQQSHKPASRPTLPRSCTTAAFAIRPTSVVVGGSVAVAVTGPPDGTYFLYVDVAAVTRGADGKVTGVPYPGVPVERTQLLVESDGLTGCFGQQSVGLDVSVQPGRHTVGLFQADRDGSETRLATTPLTVTS